MPTKHDRRVDTGGRIVQIAALALLGFMFWLDLARTENIDWAYYGAAFGVAAGADKRISKFLQK